MRVHKDIFKILQTLNIYGSILRASCISIKRGRSFKISDCKS